MAVTTTTRLGLTRWSAGGDPFTRAQMDASHAALEASAAMFAEGTLAARPAAGKAGRLYRVTDVAAEAPSVWWDTGTTWVEIRPDLSTYASLTELNDGLATKAASAHTHAAGDVTSGVFATARLGSGTANGSTILYGDGAWKAAPATSIAGASDATITSPAALQFLQYDAGTSKWVNSTITTAEVTNLDTALAGKAAASHSHLIADLPVAPSGTSNATQLVRADDSRLSNARTPTAHSHVKADVTDFAHSHTIADLPVATSGTVSATQIVRADDSRLSDSRAPSGTAGGDLTGSYPNPQLGAKVVTGADIADNTVSTLNLGPLVVTGAEIAALAVTDAKVATANKDGVVGTASMRTLGTGAQQAAAGNHGHVLTDAGITGTLPISKGGTNSTATATAGGAGYGTGTAHAYTAAGTAGQFLRSGGAGAPTWAAPTPSEVGLGNVANLAQVDLVNAQTVAGNKTFSGTTTFSGATTIVGDGDQDVLQQRAVAVETHQRNIDLTYTSGKVSSSVEKDGVTTVRTVTYSYTGDNLTSTVEVAGGKTITSTFTYDGAGDLDTITRSVA